MHIIKSEKRVPGKARMGDHLSLMNATENNSEVGGNQDVEEKDNFRYLDDKRFAFLDAESDMASNHPSPSLSAIVIPSSSKEFPEVEELYAISQDAHKITQFVMRLVLQFQPPKFHLAQPPSQQDHLAGVKPRKSKAQLALESQERFERARKSENQARKEVKKEKSRAKRLEPRKERVSQVLDDFPELLEDEES